jgi:hypothetical protein
MSGFRTSRTFDGIFLLLLVGFLGWAFMNRITLGDWVFFQTHTPSPRVTQLAAAAGLNETGRRLLYRTNPQFVTTLAEMKADCGNVENLGCLSENGTAYILDAPGKQEDVIVTAIHEMLHLAYRRLNESQKAGLQSSLDDAMSQSATRGLDAQLNGITDLVERRDEAHSILGTEYAELPDALEQYYEMYFQDRSKIAAQGQ